MILKTISGSLKLEEVDEMPKGYKKDNPFGLSLYGKEYKILVRKDMQKQLKQQTILHELIHSIENAHTFGLEEIQVEILATGLLYILKNNKKLTEYLIEK